LAKDAISTGRSAFAIIRGLFALSRGEKPVCNAVSDALVDNRLRKDAVSTGIEFPDYSGYPSSDNLACVTSVERSIRVCAHKGQAKITPGRDDTRAIFNDVTSRRSFLSRIKGVFAAADDNCHLRRQINEIFVIIRQRTRCVLCGDRYRAFFNDKNHFSTGFQQRICVAVSERRDFNRSVGFRDYSRFVRALSRGEKPVCNAVSDAPVDNRLRKDAVSTGIEFPDYSECPSGDNLACVTSVERSIRVCAHKGQAKITPGRDDTRAIFNDVTTRRSFLSRIKGVSVTGDDNCHLRRQINERFVIIRQRTRCVLLDDRYRAFSTTKTTFQPDCNRGFAERRDFNRSVDFRDSSRFVPRSPSRSFTRFGRAG
jgi:hypothetical protein